MDDLANKYVLSRRLKQPASFVWLRINPGESSRSLGRQLNSYTYGFSDVISVLAGFRRHFVGKTLIRYDTIRYEMLF